jgi:predicted phage terminase large subunit-like protein
MQNAENLSPIFIQRVKERYAGTRLGRQELDGEILDDNPYALWQRAVLDEQRVKQAPQLNRVVVGVDPAVTGNEDSDETGIIVAGKGVDGHYYVIDDQTMRGSPNEWALMVVKCYQTHKADRIVAEVNNGGDMVEATLKTVNRSLSFRAVHATRGKAIRAEPIAALYEQGKVHHVGTYPQLEDQMCEWIPNEPDQKSPDRMDAMVWALTELSTRGGVFFPTRSLY